MLIIILGLCLWIPATLGWGLPAAILRRKLAPASLSRPFDIAEAVTGLALIGVFATLANFVLKLQGIETFVLLAGWGLFAIRVRRIGIPAIGRRVMAGWGTWLVICGLLASGPIAIYDTGLYHLQSILWARDNVLPLGLANLHGRLGYNSVWFTISAVIETPFIRSFQTDFSLATALIIFFWGAAITDAALRVILDRSTRLEDLYLCVTPLLFFSFSISAGMPSASPDTPVLLLALFNAYFVLKAFAPDESLIGRAWDTLITAVFAITIKLSAAPLLLVPLCLFLIALRKETPGGLLKRSAWTAAASALVIAVPWLFRGVIVSGCLAYPVDGTCLHSLPWAVPGDAVVGEAASIRGWAQHAGVPASQVEAGWGWVSAWWFQNAFLSFEMEAPGLILVIGICMAVLASRARQTGLKQNAPAVIFIFLVSAAGTVFWFFTAPDPRFGAGYFWPPGLVILALGLGELTGSTRAANSLVGRIGRMMCIGLIIVAVVTGVLTKIALRIRGIEAAPQRLYTIEIPAPAYDTSVTVDGFVIHHPREGDQCWAAPLPCTPYFDPGLRVTKSPDGQYTGFLPASSRAPTH